MTIAEALQGVTMYPIPQATLESIALARGIAIDATATQAILKSRSFNLSKADVLLWLSYAPNISQGGQNYSFTDEQRLQYRRGGQRLLNTWEVEESTATTTFGYKGTRL